jgi:carbamoyl-phosphate synthase large subunit
MAGKTLAELGFTQEVYPPYIAVKEAVLPFGKFPNTDLILGPEMRSTGEVMGIDTDFGRAFAKAQLAAGQKLPTSGQVFISVSDRDKPLVVPAVERLLALGFSIICTENTRAYFASCGLATNFVFKISEGRPNVRDVMQNGQVQLVINTPTGKEARTDGQLIRRTALALGIPIITTVSGAIAVASAIAALQSGGLCVRSLQEYHSALT